MLGRLGRLLARLGFRLVGFGRVLWRLGRVLARLGSRAGKDNGRPQGIWKSEREPVVYDSRSNLKAFQSPIQMYDAVTKSETGMKTETETITETRNRNGN